MKKYFLYFAIILTLSNWSCSDAWINSEPMTEISDQSYYKTPEHAWETLVGCYFQVRRGFGDFFQILNVSDDLHFGGGGKNDSYGNNIWDQYQMIGGDLEINIYTWSNQYFRAILRCTILTEILDGIDWGSNTALRNRYEAEARFLRAHFLFLMQSAYGFIPLSRTSLELNTAQTDPHEVYRFIVEDLKYAINNLPNQTFQAAPSSEFGRATRWAAMALLARVYMFYSGYYADSRVSARFGGVENIGISRAEVLAYLETIINDSGHDLVPRFGSLWPFSKREDYHKDPTLTYAGEYNPEVIWCYKYSTAFTNQQVIYISMRNPPAPGGYDPFWRGWGMATVSPKAVGMYEADDERLFASIIDVEKEFDDPELKIAVMQDQRDYTGYFQKKYQSLTTFGNPSVSDAFTEGATSNDASYQDQIIIRFADVLLMAAELGSPNALDYVNRVRDRAFNDQNHRISSVDIDVIYAERAREFLTEQIRWYDLLRRGLDYAKQEIDCDYPDAVVQNSMTGDGKRIDFPLDKLGLLRIPETQILIGAGQLIQNPGW